MKEKIPSVLSATLTQSGYFRVARDPGVVWRIHYEPQAEFSILVDCAGGPRPFAEAHYPQPGEC